uniref:Uncharacterized protein n=1 Tax=Arundo donax TaxID=35708 RepID=A0A0A8Y3M7_ARUDO
MHKLMDGIF